MNFKTRVKHINKKLTKYSRILFVGLSSVGIILSFFISNISQYKFNQADTLVGALSVDLTTNGVYKVASLKDGSERLATYTNQWSSSVVQINSHYNAADYTQFNICDTTIASANITSDSQIATSDNGTSYFIDVDNQLLTTYPFDSCISTTYALPGSVFIENTNLVTYDQTTGDVYLAQTDQIVRLPSSDYTTPEFYSLINGRIYPDSLAIDHTNGYIYASFGDTHLQRFDLNNSFTVDEATMPFMSCGSKVLFQDASIYFVDNCLNSVLQYNVSLDLQHTYSLGTTIYDLVVNNSYVYVMSTNLIKKFDKNTPASSTTSNTLSGESFVNFDNVGNNMFVLSSVYRQVFEFTLTVSGTPSCPTDTPDYVLNNSRCERFVYDSHLANTYTGPAVQSVMANNNLVVMNSNGGAGGIYIKASNTFYNFPTGYINAQRLRSAADGLGVYVFFSNNTNNSNLPVIGYFDFNLATWSASYDFAGGQETPRDIVIDGDGNLISLNQGGANSTSLTFFPAGNYNSPSIIQPDFDFVNIAQKIEVDINGNLYVYATTDLRIITSNTNNYDTSVQIDLFSYGFQSTSDIFIKNNLLGGGQDIYVAGSSTSNENSVHLFTNVDLGGGMDSDAAFLTPYQYYGSTFFTNVVVDQYNNIYATPDGNTDSIAWFSDSGALHTINPPQIDGTISDIVLDASNNMYVTSHNIEYQRLDYSYYPEGSGGGGPTICTTATPSYTFNHGLCERYTAGSSDTNSGATPFRESAMVNGIFTAITQGFSGQLYVHGSGFVNLPTNFSYPSRLKSNPYSNSNYVYLIAQNSLSSNNYVLRYNLNTSSFDQQVEISGTSNLDYAFDSASSLYVLQQTGSNSTLISKYDNTFVYLSDLTLDFNFAADTMQQVQIQIVHNNIYAMSENELRILASPSYSSSALINLGSFGFKTSDPKFTRDLFVKRKFTGTVDIYVAGTNNSSRGKVQRFTNVTTSGTYSSTDEFLIANGQFGSTALSDLYVDNQDNIVFSTDSGTTQMARFTQSGTIQVFDLANVSGGTIQDVLVDSNNNIYVTSDTIAYQVLNFDTLAPSIGTNACIVNGTIDLSTVTAGDPVHMTATVTGNPDPVPFAYATGEIEIRANGTTIAYAPLNGVATTALDFTHWTAGTYTISYFFSGDEIFNSCSANIGSLTVDAISSGSLTSETTLSSSNPSNLRQITGEDMLITFHVADQATPSNVPTGDVEFRQDTGGGGFTVLDTATLNGSGNVTFNTKDLLPGFYLVYGYYLGDTSYSTSSSIVYSAQIFSIGTKTTLSVNHNPVVNGNSITLSAHVDYQNFIPTVGSAVIKSGWVRFRDSDNVTLGEALIDTNGDASIVVATSSNPVALGNLNSGVHQIRAYYEPAYENRNRWLRSSTSETLFESVVQSGGGGGSNSGSDIPPSGGEGGNSDFNATITGKDKVTGSTVQTKIGSILSWVMNYNNLGPNSNAAVTYFPIRENQDFVIGSVVVPVGWTITYSTDQGCDDASFTYTPSGSTGSTDPQVRCVRFQNDRLNVPPTRSDVRYITTSSNFTGLNVAALGGTDVYKVIQDPNSNRVFYFNHHTGFSRNAWPTARTMFCFDLEINGTCVSKNPNVVYPVNLGFDGWTDENDEYLTFETGFASNAEIINNKIYLPVTNINFNDDLGGGHGFLCWDLDTDFYCSGSAYKNGFILLESHANNAWLWGNIGNIIYKSSSQELYSSAVGTDGNIKLLCYSVALNTPCVGQPFDWGTMEGYDPGWNTIVYQPSTDRIYGTVGSSSASLIRRLGCIIATTRTLCSDFPAGGTTVLAGHPDQSVFINPYNDQMCVFSYSDGSGSDSTAPAVSCYDADSESFYDYFPSMSTLQITDWTNTDFIDSFHDNKMYFKIKNPSFYAFYCYDLITREQCSGWEGGKSGDPFDYLVYSMRFAHGCMWASSDTGRVFTFDPVTGAACNPLITLSEGNLAVKLDANHMFCNSSDSSISWNKVKVLDSGTSPSPAILNASVYDSTQCTTDVNNVVTCTGSALKSGNLLLNSGHELDISDISYASHKSLTAILEFQYPTVPSPAPGFYIELNPSTQAQMCAETKLVFNGAICANPITTICETTNISYINDPVSNNNGGQACLNVETYFGKDPNSSLCFVANNPNQQIFTVFNPNATVAPSGTTPEFNPEETYNRAPGSYSFGNGFFGFIENIIQNTVPQIINQETVRQIVNSITPQTPLAITAVTAVTTATVVATSVIAAGSGIGQIFGVLLGIIIPRKRKYWGIIYDDLTNLPVAFASITLSVKEIGTDNNMKTTVITQAVSDLEGKYRLNTEKRDKFYLEVKASGYQPFTKYIAMNNPLNATEDIVYDIPLRRLDAKPNIFKGLVNYRKLGLLKLARIILLIMSVFGFIFTIYTQINYPNLLNWILIGVYVLMFAVTLYPTIYSKIQKKGKVLDVDVNSPIAGAVVRIYNTKQQIALTLTNSVGEATFDLPAGEYSILASKRGYIMVAPEGQQLVKAVLKQEGFLDRNILMKRIEQAPAQMSTGLENPFS